MGKNKKVAIFIFVVIAIFGLSAAVMWLWNFAVVPAFQANPLSYWQAMALLVLSKILFVSPKFGPGGFARRKWQSHMRHMSDEDRDRMKEQWRRRCEQRSEK